MSDNDDVKIIYLKDLVGKIIVGYADNEKGGIVLKFSDGTYCEFSCAENWEVEMQ